MKSKNIIYLLIFCLTITSGFAKRTKKEAGKKSCPSKVYIPGDRYKGHKCPKAKNVKNAKYY